jgi:hypothetical protein
MKDKAIYIRATEKEKNQCIRLAEQAGFVHDHRGNMSEFLSLLIREGKIRSVTQAVDFVQSLSEDERVFVVRV